MRRSLALVVPGLFACAAVACSLVIAPFGEEAAPPDPAEVDPGQTPTVAEAGEPDLVPTDAGDASVACPGDAGPVSVRVGAYCVDATEVTNEQYSVFLGASAVERKPPPASCAWNASFVPAGWPPPVGSDRLPVVNVDWCDAWSYCAWAGKRLCAGLDGGVLHPNELSEAGADAWFNACSAGGTHRLPYGDVLEAGACNVGDGGDAGKAFAVGRLPRCQGGYSGLFDMVGNVAEWVDSCKTQDGGTDSCVIRASSFAGDLTSDCASTAERPRNTATPSRGFRCCSY